MPTKQFGKHPTAALAPLSKQGTTASRVKSHTAHAPTTSKAPPPHPSNQHRTIHASQKRQSTVPPAIRSPRKRSSVSRNNPSLKATSPPVNTTQLRNDRLGTLVRDLTCAFLKAGSWEEFVNDFRGPSYLSPELENVDHAAAELLRYWRDEGVPAETTQTPWTNDQKDHSIHRGCHPSATEHSTFLREEMAELIESKFWAVLPYDLIRHLEELMLSPAAVKEERDRKPRLLCDHSWPWPWGSTNESTVPHAPPEAMQFGGTLHRLLYLVRHADPKFGPVRINKQDLKDAFYRMFLRALDCLHLALILPRYEGEPQLVAIPLATTMGWVQSPPTFCAMSETVCDVANANFKASPLGAQPHRLSPTAEEHDDLDPSTRPRPREPEDLVADDALAELPGITRMRPETEETATRSNKPLKRPVGHTDVFVDDFIQLGQGSNKRMNSLRNHLLHAIDQVLAQPSVSEAHRNEAVSMKKLLKGDGSWETRKLVLGWIIDTLRQTLELPPHRKLQLASLFSSLAKTKRVTEKVWRSVLGKLRFVSQAIPGSAGLFCALQLALNRSSDGRIRITKSLRHHVNAFASLAASLCHRPTHLAEIVPQEPTLLGATDAAKMGMGGVYFDAEGNSFLWRQPFADEISSRLVSTDNPEGSVTNSDLEQAGLLAQLSLMTSTHDTRYATIVNACDNTPAVSRASKGAVSSDGPASFLCGLACLHQRDHRYCHQAFYLPGPDNVMADDASRLQHLSNDAFLSHFEQHYPQTGPWKLLQLPPATVSALTSALLSRSPASPLQARLDAPTARSSTPGSLSATPTGKTLPSVISAVKRTSSATCSPSPTATEPVAKPATVSELAQWIRPYWRWARGSPTWVARIPESRFADPSETIPYSKLSSSASRTKTTQPPEPTLPTSPSSADSQIASTPTTASMASSTNTSSTSSSSPSSGSCGPRNTLTPALRKPGPRLSASATSNSPRTVRFSLPPKHL